MRENLKGKEPLGRSGRRWDDTIKIITKEIWREGMDRNNLLRSGTPDVLDRAVTLVSSKDGGNCWLTGWLLLCRKGGLPVFFFFHLLLLVLLVVSHSFFFRKQLVFIYFSLL